MALSESRIIAAHATMFTAAADTELPEDLAGFTVTADTVETGWKNIGHTSANDRMTFEKEDGDTTTLATAIHDNDRVIYQNGSVTVTGKHVQSDKDTLKFIFNGWDYKSGMAVPDTPVANVVAAFFLVQDTNGERAGIYIPRLSIAPDGAPDFSQTDYFVTFGFKGTALTSDKLKSTDGKSSSWAIFPNAAFAKA